MEFNSSHAETLKKQLEQIRIVLGNEQKANYLAST